MANQRTIKLVHDWFTHRIYHPFMSCANQSDTGTQPGQQRYHSLLLRYWREDGVLVWRYVVQDLATGEEYGFADVDLLIAFLYQRMESHAQ